jgi:chitin synthase
MLRFSAFRRMAKVYFADKAEQCSDLFDYWKCHLGEDRWLTHLFMIGARERYQIQMNTGAFCKTEAVQEFMKLIKQRRRWFLGFMSNEVCMITDIRLWKKYPLLCVIRLAQNTIRTTALLFFIMVISIVSTEEAIGNLPVGFIGVSLGLNWALMLFFGFKLGRYKACLYPLMFVLNPFLNWMYMVYGIFTAGQRTWGGPRADAAKADVTKTPAQAIEQAEQAGDELNVVPETFKPAIEATSDKPALRAPLLPSDYLQGRFAPAELLPGGFFQQSNDSGMMYPNTAPRDLEAMIHPKEWRRDSMESDRSITSIHFPRRVESLFLEQPIDLQARDRSLTRNHQLSDLDRMVMAARTGPYTPFRTRASSLESYDSGALSETSVPMHFSTRNPYQMFDTSAPLTVRTPYQRLPHQQPQPQFKSARPRRHSTPPPASQAFVRRDSFGGLRRSLDGGDLGVPVSSQRPGGRLLQFPQSSANRTGKSPLARKSFERIASPPREDDPDAPMSAAHVIELERASATRASQEAERRGRERTSFQRPRKLSKQRPGSSRSSSKG